VPIPTLHEALYGKPDPLAPHLEEALKSLGVVSSAIWRQTLEAMAGEIRHAGQRGRMQRAKGIGTYQRGNKRVDAKKMLDDIARFAKSINDLMDLEEVRGALDFFAPISQRGIDDVAGFEYLQQLETRASRARAKIRTGKGGGLLRDDLGIPSPRLLCAACVGGDVGNRRTAPWLGQSAGLGNMPRALACRGRFRQEPG
jgi:hypothetical protein